MTATLPLDEPAQLLGEAIDQPSAQAGITASEIDPAAVIDDGRANAAASVAIELHHDGAARVPGE